MTHYRMTFKRKCSECGEEFTMQRNDKFTCSATCRSRLARRLKAEAQQRQAKVTAVRYLAQTLKLKGEIADLEALKEIERIAREAILENSRQLMLALGE